MAAEYGRIWQQCSKAGKMAAHFNITRTQWNLFGVNHCENLRLSVLCIALCSFYHGSSLFLHIKTSLNNDQWKEIWFWYGQNQHRTVYFIITGKADLFFFCSLSLSLIIRMGRNFYSYIIFFYFKNEEYLIMEPGSYQKLLNFANAYR